MSGRTIILIILFLLSFSVVAFRANEYALLQHVSSKRQGTKEDQLHISLFRQVYYVIETL